MSGSTPQFRPDKSAITAGDMDLAWIVSSADTPDYRVSKSDRATIRKQAMSKAAISRRKRGNYGQSNLGQYPVSVLGTCLTRRTPVPLNISGLRAKPPSEYDHHGSPDRSSPHVLPQQLVSIPSAMPLSELTQLSCISGIDLLQLSGLTATHVGHAVSTFFHHHPTRLVSLLRQPRTSYLHHINNRYGQSQCLDHAVRALAFQARCLLAPDDSAHRTLALKSHGEAIHSLQRAINNPRLCMQPDVLCATELLGLIEILHCSTENSWPHHVSGASQLIQFRGPGRFQSDYEKDLLLSLVGPLMCEAVRNNKACFLQEPCWQVVLASSALPGVHPISERSGLTVRLRKLMALLPSLFRRVSSVICHDRENSSHELQSLVSDIRNFRSHMLQNYAQLRKWHLDLSYGSEPPENVDLLYELFGTTLMALATANRLLTALGDSQASSLEADNLHYVAELEGLEADLLSSNGWVNFYLHQKMSIAASITNTATIWETAPGEVIEKWRFDRWCRAMQRETCNCTAWETEHLSTK